MTQVDLIMAAIMAMPVIGLAIMAWLANRNSRKL